MFIPPIHSVVSLPDLWGMATSIAISELFGTASAALKAFSGCCFLRLSGQG